MSDESKETIISDDENLSYEEIVKKYGAESPQAKAVKSNPSEHAEEIVEELNFQLDLMPQADIISRNPSIEETESELTLLGAETIDGQMDMKASEYTKHLKEMSSFKIVGNAYDKDGFVGCRATSPDGQSVKFRAKRVGANDVFRIPASEKTPEQKATFAKFIVEQAEKSGKTINISKNMDPTLKDAIMKEAKDKVEVNVKQNAILKDEKKAEQAPTPAKPA